jgi:hypothetical protein
MPAKAGIQQNRNPLDSRFPGNDEVDGARDGIEVP